MQKVLWYLHRWKNCNVDLGHQGLIAQGGPHGRGGNTRGGSPFLQHSEEVGWWIQTWQREILEDNPAVEGWSLSPHRRLLTRSLTRITQQCIATELGVSQNKVSAHLLLRLLCPDEKQIGHDMSTGNLAILLSDQMLCTCFLGCKGSAASIRLDKGQS